MYQRCEKCVFVQEVAALVYQRCDEHVFVQEVRLWCTNGNRKPPTDEGGSSAGGLHEG